MVQRVFERSGVGLEAGVDDWRVHCNLLLGAEAGNLRSFVEIHPPVVQRRSFTVEAVKISSEDLLGLDVLLFGA